MMPRICFSDCRMVFEHKKRFCVSAFHLNNNCNCVSYQCESVTVLFSSSFEAICVTYSKIITPLLFYFVVLLFLYTNCPITRRRKKAMINYCLWQFCQLSQHVQTKGNNDPFLCFAFFVLLSLS